MARNDSAGSGAREWNSDSVSMMSTDDTAGCEFSNPRQVIGGGLKLPLRFPVER